MRGEAAHVVLAPVGLGDRLDDRFLGREVAIERARAHAALGADLLHRGALEAGPDEAVLGCLEDALDLLVAPLGARHARLPSSGSACSGLEIDAVFHAVCRP